MTTIERTIENMEVTDFRSLKLKAGDVFNANGKTEIVTETHHDGKRLVRFRTARRDGGGIVELGYSVDKETGKPRQLFSGIYFGEKNALFHVSERYFELNKILEEQEK